MNLSGFVRSIVALDNSIVMIIVVVWALVMWMLRAWVVLLLSRSRLRCLVSRVSLRVLVLRNYSELSIVLSLVRSSEFVFYVNSLDALRSNISTSVDARLVRFNVIIDLISMSCVGDGLFWPSVSMSRVLVSLLRKVVLALLKTFSGMLNVVIVASARRVLVPIVRALGEVSGPCAMVRNVVFVVFSVSFIMMLVSRCGRWDVSIMLVIRFGGVVLVSYVSSLLGLIVVAFRARRILVSVVISVVSFR